MGADFPDEVRATIMANLGHDPGPIPVGKLHRFSTSRRRGDDAGWCIVFTDGRAAMYGCHRLGVREHVRNAEASPLTRRQRNALAREVAAATRRAHAEQVERWRRNAERNRRLQAESRPVEPDDPVALYLARRGFADLWPLPPMLRHHPALPYWDHDGHDLGRHPAMVAPMVAPDGRIVAWHRTYLTADGCKADLPTIKKLTGTSGPVHGACVPLHRPKRGAIGIAEGIETALAAWCIAGVPTVAAYCSANLAAWVWPAGLRHLVIFADNDGNGAGQRAAAELESRALAAGIMTRIEAPSSTGADWCDVWAESREGAT